MNKIFFTLTVLFTLIVGGVLYPVSVSADVLNEVIVTPDNFTDSSPYYNITMEGDNYLGFDIPSGGKYLDLFWHFGETNDTMLYLNQNNSINCNIRFSGWGGTDFPVNRVEVLLVDRSSGNTLKLVTFRESDFTITADGEGTLGLYSINKSFSYVYSDSATYAFTQLRLRMYFDNYGSTGLTNPILFTINRSTQFFKLSVASGVDAAIYPEFDDSSINDSQALENEILGEASEGLGTLESVFSSIGTVFDSLGSGVVFASGVVNAFVIQVPVVNSLLTLSLSLGITAFLLWGGVTIITGIINKQDSTSRTKNRSSRKRGNG